MTHSGCVSSGVKPGHMVASYWVQSTIDQHSADDSASMFHINSERPSCGHNMHLGQS